MTFRLFQLIVALIATVLIVSCDDAQRDRAKEKTPHGGSKPTVPYKTSPRSYHVTDEDVRESERIFDSLRQDTVAWRRDSVKRNRIMRRKLRKMELEQLAPERESLRQ